MSSGGKGGERRVEIRRLRVRVWRLRVEMGSVVESRNMRGSGAGTGAGAGAESMGRGVSGGLVVGEAGRGRPDLWLRGLGWCGEGCIPVTNALMLLAAFAKKFHMDAAR